MCEADFDRQSLAPDAKQSLAPFVPKNAHKLPNRHVLHEQHEPQADWELKHLHIQLLL